MVRRCNAAIFFGNGHLVQNPAGKRHRLNHILRNNESIGSVLGNVQARFHIPQGTGLHGKCQAILKGRRQFSFVRIVGPN